MTKKKVNVDKTSAECTRKGMDQCSTNNLLDHVTAMCTFFLIQGQIKWSGVQLFVA